MNKKDFFRMAGVLAIIKEAGGLSEEQEKAMFDLGASRDQIDSVLNEAHAFFCEASKSLENGMDPLTGKSLITSYNIN